MPESPSRLALDQVANPGLARDVIAGFTREARRLPSKYIYDARGSELFEQITRLPEYYLTRAETAILTEYAADIARHSAADELVEIGSGFSVKTRLLLEALHETLGSHCYVPLDVSEHALAEAKRELSARYDWLKIEGHVADFDQGFPDFPHAGKRLVAFLGSTIGNLTAAKRIQFLTNVAELMDSGDSFLLGVDLVKDPAVLEAAYNDSAGVTAQFNRNVLHVLNRELDGDLPVEAFEHRARYSEAQQRIESSLRATRPVQAMFAAIDLQVDFEAGEEIQTEISCKFTEASTREVLAHAGLILEHWYTDPEQRFGLALARRARKR